MLTRQNRWHDQLDSDAHADARAATLDKLAVALRTQPMRFVLAFLAEEGLTLLLDMLAAMDHAARCGGFASEHA